MASSDNAATIAAVADKVRTVGQARVALGNLTRLLQQAYAKTDDADLWDESELKDSIRGRLDVVNNYAQKIYGTLPSDDASQGDPVPAATAPKIGLVLAQAQEACKDIEKALKENQFDIAGTILEGLHLAAETAGHVADKATKGLLAAIFAFVRSAWLPIVIALGVVAVWFFWPRILRRFANERG